MKLVRCNGQPVAKLSDSPGNRCAPTRPSWPTCARCSTFLFIKQAFLKMKGGGAVVNVSSVHAVETEPLVAPYAAAKTALLSLTRSAALEGKPKGVRVNAVLPGAVDTPMLWDNPNVRSGAEVINKAEVGTPDDIAAAIVFLCGDDANFIWGAGLRVDGGRLVRL
jgi:NAD(P)-dependent dehydrogenase (short-subunit alcohol dehydrogenase family)